MKLITPYPRVHSELEKTDITAYAYSLRSIFNKQQTTFLQIRPRTGGPCSQPGFVYNEECATPCSARMAFRSRSNLQPAAKKHTTCMQLLQSSAITRV